MPTTLIRLNLHKNLFHDYAGIKYQKRNLKILVLIWKQESTVARTRSGLFKMC